MFSKDRIFLCMCQCCDDSDMSSAIIIKIICIITFLRFYLRVCWLLRDHSTFYAIKNFIHHILLLRLDRFGASQKKQKINRKWHWFEIKYAISLKISKIEKILTGICDYIPIAFKWYLCHSIILNIFIETASSPIVVIRTTIHKAWINHVLTYVESNWCICTVVKWKHRKKQIILTISTDFVRCEFLSKKWKISL